MDLLHSYIGKFNTLNACIVDILKVQFNKLKKHIPGNGDTESKSTVFKFAIVAS